MKKLVAYICSGLFCVLFLTACGVREKPEQVVEVAYYAVAAGDYDAAVLHLSTLDFFNVVQEAGKDYDHPAWIEFWESVVPTDDIVSIVFDDVRRYKAWTRVYMTINTSDGTAIPHEQLLLLQEKAWKITMLEFNDPALERTN